MNARHLSIDELADALEEASGGPSPHRFSQGWDCARKVTGGRITGLASSTVDGTPALLVYMKSEDSTQVTVVTGCRVGMPSAPIGCPAGLSTYLE